MRYFTSIKFQIAILLLLTVSLLLCPILTVSSQSSTVVTVVPSTVSARIQVDQETGVEDQHKSFLKIMLG